MFKATEVDPIVRELAVHGPGKIADGRVAMEQDYLGAEKQAAGGVGFVIEMTDRGNRCLGGLWRWHRGFIDPKFSANMA